MKGQVNDFPKDMFLKMQALSLTSRATGSARVLEVELGKLCLLKINTEIFWGGSGDESGLQPPDGVSQDLSSSSILIVRDQWDPGNVRQM